MTLYTTTARHDSRLLYWAFLLSILLHMLVALIKVNTHRTQTKLTDVLTVRIVHAKPTQVTTIEIPQTLPSAKPKAQIKPKQIPPPQVQTPEKAESPRIVTVVAIQEKSPISAAIPATEQEAEAISKATPAEPYQAQVNTQHANAQYGALLAQEISKYKQYPVLAKKTRQQGNIILKVQITSLGKLIDAQIYQSSGYELLDNQAIDMVKKATPFSQPPATLGEQNITLLVPVSFRLN